MKPSRTNSKHEGLRITIFAWMTFFVDTLAECLVPAYTGLGVALTGWSQMTQIFQAALASWGVQSLRILGATSFP